MTRTTQLEPEHQHTHQVAGQGMLISALFIALLGFVSLEIIPLPSAVVLLLLALVFFAFRVWVEMLDQEADH